MSGRHRIGIATLLSVGLVISPMMLAWSPRLIWNASASVPIGLYAARPVEEIRVDDLVTVYPSDDLVRFLDKRGYVNPGTPLIKYVAALSGTTVCRKDNTIIVGTEVRGRAQKQDREGRALPTWQGCQVLGPGEVFFLNHARPDSLDSRYFGPLPVSTIAARLTPLWID
ncbi:Peptidase S26 [Labrenzia sp. THAF82]|uniref:S26 family signal peptidase n=1 Tax=Labrenzia sp. THAF82 TaxID=2587861 RepID=UPI0012695215|nr:S26 family signal peptidase [Labrenzia sp. THAF82]QFT34100.1 Peptidase S26 [Labrenzia sp. THAF82]